MSIDLSRYDIYNYEFYLRPNGQSVKPTFGNLSTITEVSDNLLKSQTMNIPGQYNVNPGSKVYLYLRDIHINTRDTLAILRDEYQSKHYLQIKTATQYNYSNFKNSQIGDEVVQNAQPNHALIPINYVPLVANYDTIPVIGSSMSSSLLVTAHINTDIPGTMFVKEDRLHTLIPSVKADTNNKSSELGVERSGLGAYIEVPVRFTQTAQVPAVVDPAADAIPGFTTITKVGSNQEIKGLTLDKSTNILDRMVCVHNPFGNILEFQILNLDPSMIPNPGPAGALDGKTAYKCQAVAMKPSGAVIVSFSLLVEKDYSKTY